MSLQCARAWCLAVVLAGLGGTPISVAQTPPSALLGPTASPIDLPSALRLASRSDRAVVSVEIVIVHLPPR